MDQKDLFVVLLNCDWLLRTLHQFLVLKGIMVLAISIIAQIKDGPRGCLHGHFMPDLRVAVHHLSFLVIAFQAKRVTTGWNLARVKKEFQWQPPPASHVVVIRNVYIGPAEA